MGVKTKVKSFINLRWDPYLNWIMNNETAEDMPRIFKNEASGINYCLYKDICVAYCIIHDASVIFKRDSINMPLPVAYTEGNHTLYNFTELSYTDSGTRFNNFTDQATHLLSHVLFPHIGFPVMVIEFLQYYYKDLDLGFIPPSYCGMDENNTLFYKNIALSNIKAWKNNIMSCDVFYRYSELQEYFLAGHLEFEDIKDTSSIHITYFPNSAFSKNINLKEIDYSQRPNTIREIFESDLTKLESLDKKVCSIFINSNNPHTYNYKNIEIDIDEFGEADVYHNKWGDEPIFHINIDDTTNLYDIYSEDKDESVFKFFYDGNPFLDKRILMQIHKLAKQESECLDGIYGNDE